MRVSSAADCNHTAPKQGDKNNYSHLLLLRIGVRNQFENVIKSIYIHCDMFGRGVTHEQQQQMECANNSTWKRNPHWAPIDILTPFCRLFAQRAKWCNGINFASMIYLDRIAEPNKIQFE